MLYSKDGAPFADLADADCGGGLGNLAAVVRDGLPAGLPWRLEPLCAEGEEEQDDADHP